MAGLSLLALLDDIATVLDDVALMSKVAAKKTVGVLGDDLALNAQQVSGVRAEREIPVVWAVAKGSLLNKAIIVPIALILSTFLPAAITVLLLIGGVYLSFEGFEKVLHYYFPHEDKEQTKKQRVEANSDDNINLVAVEKDKIKGAIRTDFILSAEVVVISLGTIATATLLTQVLTLVGVSIALTLAVYGFVAVIVKMDDLGLYLIEKSEDNASLTKSIGQFLLTFAPILMKLLVVVGTIAMFLVGGGLIVHHIPLVTEFYHHLEQSLLATNIIFQYLAPTTVIALVGLIAGASCFLIVKLIAGSYMRFCKKE